MVPGYDHVSKAVLPDLGIHPYPECQVVPFMELIHDRLAIEISRGCTRGCRFCQAGMIYRPVRERMPGALLQSALKSLRATGYEELSLLSLSSGDYTCIEPLLKALMDRLSREKTALSLPSLRVGSLSTAMMEEIKRVRKTGFTLAVEAATPRLRAVINKRLTDEEVLEMAGEAYGSGWRLIKLYFMIGLPTETDEDLLAIARLSKRIARLSGRGGGRPRLNVSLSTFIPKPHTPFQWAPQISIDESKRRMALVQREIRGSTIQVKWNPPELSWLEGILSRGDRRLARVILKAWASGARFDAWSECFSRKIWETALSDAHVDPNEYLHRERSIHESLPWDHIRSGVSKDYLAEEWRKAREGLTTSDCREGCLECGVCDQVNVRPRLIEGPKEPLTASESGHGPSGAACIPYRIHFGKRGDARFLSHLELTRALVRAVRRCAMPVAYSSGFHPLPKIAFLSALPVGTESLDEMVDIEMTGTLDLSETLQRLRQELPQGIEIHALTPIDPLRAARRIKETRYRVWVPGAVLKQDALEGFLNSERFLVRKRTQKGERDVDARPLVSAVTLLAPDALEVVIAHGSGPELRPAEIVGRIFSLDESLQCHVRILKLNDVLIV
jgi:radical SAM-linked protein